MAIIIYVHLPETLSTFRRHLLETEGHEQLLASCGSPDLIEAAGIVVTVQDVNNKGAHSSEPGDREGSFSGAQAVGGQPDNSDGTCIYISMLAPPSPPKYSNRKGHPHDTDVVL